MLKVDLGELKNEGESLSNFLHSKLKVHATTDENKVFVNSEKLTTEEVKNYVTKFVYRRNLSNKYYVAIEHHLIGSPVIVFKKFKRIEKKHKKKGTPPSMMKHGW